MHYFNKVIPINNPAILNNIQEEQNDVRYDYLIDIIDKKYITTVFQPIFNMRTADIYAYEALTRVVGFSPFSGAEDLFRTAQEFNLTATLEKICRTQALINRDLRNIEFPIMLNICPSILQFSEHEKNINNSIMQELFHVRDKIILELTERFYIQDTKLFKKTVDYYREHGFKIAIDDLGSGFTGLNMLIQTEPFMVKIDRTIIKNIDKNHKKRMLLEAVIKFCHKINALVVAEGIETEDELKMLIEMKVDLGQGYLLARPAEHPRDCSPNIEYLILRLNQKTFSSGTYNDINNCVQSIVKHKKPISVNATVAEVINRFKIDDSLNCLPIVDHNVPVGLINKNQLYYKLGQRFGYDLFIRKKAKNIMESALIFEYDTPLEEVSKKVLNRDEQSIYDSIIIVHNGAYLGIVKIHQILERITEQKINMAKQANPISGLPGNNLIKEEIEQRLNTNQIFAVMYFDLNYFKPFNDYFGFGQGDRVIRFLAMLLKDVISSWDLKSFIGHIGGDDFVALCRAQDVEILCKSILKKFDCGIKNFHTAEIIKQGYYEGKNRNGKEQRFSLLSLSIAVVSTSKRSFDSYGHLVSVASEVKKKVKKLSGSRFFIDQRLQ
ncbi:Diguanylate cyclase/phosphodiesterase [Candidatus Magnetomoraceae bacterium gMMP-1]